MSEKAKKKYVYEFMAGEPTNKKIFCFCFPYAATKVVKVEVSKNFVKILFESPQSYNLDERFGYWRNLLREGYKRAGFVHILMYDGMMKQMKRELRVMDSTGTEIAKKELTIDFDLYSMINCRILRKIPASIKRQEVIDKVFGVSKKDFDNRNAALNAYVYSKYKELETERFLYLWMSFNGAYSLIGKKANKDRENIEATLKEFHEGDCIFSRAQREKHERKMMSLFAGLHQKEVCEELRNPKSETYQRIKAFIGEVFENKGLLTPYGFVLGEFAYYLRCNYFHANNAFLLMTYLDDLEFEALSCVNIVLEQFLDDNLFEILTEY